MKNTIWLNSKTSHFPRIFFGKGILIFIKSNYLLRSIRQRKLSVLMPSERRRTKYTT